MTYALCNATNCANHDGEGCTLEEVELSQGMLNAYAVMCQDFDAIDYDYRRVRVVEVKDGRKR